MARKKFESHSVMGRDSDVCGLTGNMADKPRMNELANKRGVGILLGKAPIELTGSLAIDLADARITETQAKAKINNGKSEVVYFDANIRFKDLADNYCGVNSKTQILFFYDE